MKTITFLLTLKVRVKKMSEKTIQQKLLSVITTLKAPKGQYNDFGKYTYRSAEDILEAVKPICYENGLLPKLSDEVIMIGERYYIKATVSVQDDSGTMIESVGLAREPESKKGMDGSQITGTASSYARKYALNGLFLIDDTKDADTDENRRERQNRSNNQNSSPKKATKAQKDELKKSFEEIASMSKKSAKTVEAQMLAVVQFDRKFDDLTVDTYEQLRPICKKQINKLEKQVIKHDGEETVNWGRVE